MAETLFLSLELMYLMEWLMKHEQERLRVLIKYALNNGLDTKLEHAQRHKQRGENKLEEKLHDTFLEFINFLEHTLFDAVEKRDEKNAIQDELVSALSRLNLNNIDTQTVWSSMKQARSTLSKTQKNRENSPQDIENVLLEKVLDNWQPDGDEAEN